MIWGGDGPGVRPSWKNGSPWTNDCKESLGKSKRLFHLFCLFCLFISFVVSLVHTFDWFHPYLFLPSCSVSVFLPSCFVSVFLPSCSVSVFLPSCSVSVFTCFSSVSPCVYVGVFVSVPSASLLRLIPLIPLTPYQPPPPPRLPPAPPPSSSSYNQDIRSIITASAPSV
jgi:hypothetical protein